MSLSPAGPPGLSAGCSSFYSCSRIYANSASSVTSQLISLRHIPGSVPFADTSRVWIDVVVRVIATVAGGSQLVATVAKMAAPHTGGGALLRDRDGPPATWHNVQSRFTNLFW